MWKILHFPWKHKYPVNRSAFSYCEGHNPSHLDLGKEQYHGRPFTTEEVEDIKTFLRQLLLLLTLFGYHVAVCPVAISTGSGTGWSMCSGWWRKYLRIGWIKKRAIPGSKLMNREFCLTSRHRFWMGMTAYWTEFNIIKQVRTQSLFLKEHALCENTSTM